MNLLVATEGLQPASQIVKLLFQILNSIFWTIVISEEQVMGVTEMHLWFFVPDG
jgi:hypothetical protein